jgi:dTMP kinase
VTGGTFVTLEGIEGVGKTSAMAHVAAWFRDRGHEVVCTREPGSTALGERVRELLLDPHGAAIAPLTELLLMFAARAQHLAEVVRPALAAGRTVVCDRFTDATYAYQGGGRGLADVTIAGAERLVHPDLQPHLTLLLDAEPRVALARAATRGTPDRFESERLAFFGRVRAAYLARARALPARFAIVDASWPLADVHAAIADILARRCT